MDILNPLWNNQFGTFFSSDAEEIFDHEFAAVILAANPANFEQLLALKSYPANDIYTLQKAQFSVLKSLRAGFLQPANVLFYLRKLSALGTAEICELLEQFSAQIADLPPQNPRESSAADSAANRLKSAKNLADRAAAALSAPRAAELAASCAKIDAGEYKIAFAGCFNAGKSSALNALLGRDLLGTSNAPETAAISVISAAPVAPDVPDAPAAPAAPDTTDTTDTTDTPDTPAAPSSPDAPLEFARIEYFSSEEFEQIKQLCALSPECAKRLRAMDFTPQKAAQISLRELAARAGASDFRSAFIKRIEVFLRSPLLAERLVFIDTPGLDDIIISREQASRAMLKTVDEIAYLMPATQALSAKDCDFLCSLAEQNPAINFTLVLSKIDLVEPSELGALEAYVREKFSAALAERELKNRFMIFAISTANAYGIDVLAAYLRQKARQRSGRQSAQLSALIIRLLNDELAELSAAFKQGASAEAAAQVARAQNAAQIAEQNAALNALCQEFEALLTELNSRQILAANDLFLLAKKIAAKTCAEYDYSEKFSKENATAQAAQAFSDFVALKNSQNKHFLNTCANRAKQIAKKAQEFAASLGKNFSTTEAALNFSAPLGSEDFAAAIRRFNVLAKSPESTMAQRLEAILNNLDLSALLHNEAASALCEQINFALLALAALRPAPTAPSPADTAAVTAADAATADAATANSSGRPPKTEASGVVNSQQLQPRLEEIKQILNECKDFAQKEQA